MASRVLVIRGLGRTTVQSSKKRTKGRGPNERALNAIKDDARADEQAAKQLGRRRIKQACQTRRRRVRKELAAAVDVVRAEGAAAVEEAAAACTSAREGAREAAPAVASLPRAERGPVREAIAAEVHTACRDKLPRVRTEARAALAEMRALRRAGNAAASEGCERMREEVPRLVGGYLAQREAKKRLELDEARANLYPPKAPRTPAQKSADRERAARMRGKTKHRAGGARTMIEEADMEGANVPPAWHWLWRRHAFEFVRRARAWNAAHPNAPGSASASELFGEWLEGHGVRDMWEEGPAQSDFAQEFEALQLAELERERLEHELDEAEAAGFSREEARAELEKIRTPARSAVRKAAAPRTDAERDQELADLFG